MRMSFLLLPFIALVSPALGDYNPIEIQGKPVLPLLAAAEVLGAKANEQGKYQVEGELILHRREGKLGGLFSTSYGMTLIIGKQAQRVKRGPIEVIDTLVREWSNQAPFERDNHWTVRPKFTLTAEKGKELATASLLLEYPVKREVSVSCMSADPKSGPFLFGATIKLDGSLTKATLREVKVVNFLRTGEHIANGGVPLFEPGAFDVDGDEVEFGYAPNTKTMSLTVTFSGQHRLEIKQDEAERGETYGGTFTLAKDTGELPFVVQCRLSRNY